MAEQKALLIESKQGSFVVGTKTIPKPGPGDLLVKIHATALNPIDWKIQEYDIFIEEYPAVVGSDGAGDVEAIGEGVEGWAKGDRVFFQGFFTNDLATFQQYALIPAEIAGKIPGNISYSQAASVPLGFNTAAIGLYGDRPGGAGASSPWDGKARYKGQPAVVIGGSTSVGQYAIQLLKYSGFGPIIAYASPHNYEHLKSLGAEEFIDRTKTPLDHLVSALNHINTTPIHIVFDCVGSVEAQENGYQCLSGGGQLITVLEDKVPKEVKSEGRTVIAPFGNMHAPANRAVGKAVYEHLPRLLEEGVIKPNRVEDLPNGLEGIIGGLERLRKDQVSGIKLIGHPQETV